MRKTVVITRFDYEVTFNFSHGYVLTDRAAPFNFLKSRPHCTRTPLTRVRSPSTALYSILDIQALKNVNVWRIGNLKNEKNSPYII